MCIFSKPYQKFTFKKSRKEIFKKERTKGRKEEKGTEIFLLLSDVNWLLFRPACLVYLSLVMLHCLGNISLVGLLANTPFGRTLRYLLWHSAATLAERCLASVLYHYFLSLSLSWFVVWSNFLTLLVIALPLSSVFWSLVYHCFFLFFVVVFCVLVFGYCWFLFLGFRFVILYCILVISLSPFFLFAGLRYLFIYSLFLSITWLSCHSSINSFCLQIIAFSLLSFSWPPFKKNIFIASDFIYSFSKQLPSHCIDLIFP